MFNKKQIVVALALIASLNTIVSANTWDVTSTWAETIAVTSATTSVDVSWVDVVDANTLSVNFSWELTNWVSDTSDVKIFKDMKVLSSEKDLDDAKKITVKLDEELDFWGFGYSLFSVSSIDTSIDFELNSTTSGSIANSVAWEEWIDHINIVDAKTIEIFLRKDLTSDLTDLKMLKEVKIESMFYDLWTLNVKTNTALMSNSAYFFMFISLKDSMNNEITVTNSMYDFNTPEFQVVSEELNAPTATWALENTASGTELSASWELMPIEDAAMQATSTPDTWAKTNILIALALLLSLAFVAVRRKSFKI